MAQRCAICSALLRPAALPPRATCERGACQQEYRRRIAHGCPICGRECAGESCGHEYCAAELEQRRRRLVEERERQERKAAQARALDQELRRRPDVPASAVLAILPATDRPVQRQDPTRRTLFSERLTDLMETAIADPEGPTGDTVEPDLPPTGDARLIASACASCRGSCCRHGEDHAFLRPATLRRFLKAHPGLTPAKAKEEYLRRLPAESIAGGCVFQGREGCTLPRSMRSDVCNRYHCEDLETLRKSTGAAPVLVIGFDEDRYVRASLIGDGVRTIAEAPSGGSK